MFKVYLKMAIRQILKRKSYTVIIVMGLAISIALSLLLAFYIHYEWSFDRFHKNPEQVFRVLIEGSPGSRNSLSPPLLSSQLKKEFPEIQSAVELRGSSGFVHYRERTFSSKILYTEPSLFEVFTFPAVSGNLASTLSNPSDAVITQSLAKRIFGDEDPIGKMITQEYTRPRKISMDFKIVSVIEDIPSNSHFRFDLALPKSALNVVYKPIEFSWNIFIGHTYIRFRESADLHEFQQKLPDFIERTGGDRNSQKLLLQPLTDIHLNPISSFDNVEPISWRELYIYAGIACLVLIIAGINYIILVTARIIQRVKEVGIRKIVGATRSDIGIQFLLEAFLLASLTIPFALGIVEIAHPAFGEIMGRTLILDHGNYWFFLGSIGLICIFILAISLYPAFLFSRFSPIPSLKNIDVQFRISRKLWNGLIITQFGIATALIICVAVMISQLQYTRSSELGYRTERLLVINTRGLGKSANVLKQIALSHSGVESATVTSWLPGYLSGTTTMANPNGEGMLVTEFINGDSDFITTYQMKLKKGRDLTPGTPSDTMQPNDGNENTAEFRDRPGQTSIILNETAVKVLNLSSPVGQVLDYPAIQGTVIGIIKDIHNRSLYYPIRPMVIKYFNDAFDLVIAYRPGAESELINYLEKAWERLGGKTEFDYKFVDDHLKSLYRADEKLLEIIIWFAGFAIFISCIGLFGISHFATERRIKEIGIRKVLGATVANVTTLLSKDFIKLVLLANIIAWPVAWYAMNKWLQNFAYRIDISWWVFVLAGGLAMLIALLTVSIQAIRAALSNPVDALRYE